MKQFTADLSGLGRKGLSAAFLMLVAILAHWLTCRAGSAKCSEDTSVIQESMLNNAKDFQVTPMPEGYPPYRLTLRDATDYAFSVGAKCSFSLALRDGSEFMSVAASANACMQARLLVPAMHQGNLIVLAKHGGEYACQKELTAIGGYSYDLTFTQRDMRANKLLIANGCEERICVKPIALEAWPDDCWSLLEPDQLALVPDRTGRNERIALLCIKDTGGGSSSPFLLISRRDLMRCGDDIVLLRISSTSIGLNIANDGFYSMMGNAAVAGSNDGGDFETPTRGDPWIEMARFRSRKSLTIAKPESFLAKGLTGLGQAETYPSANAPIHGVTIMTSRPFERVLLIGLDGKIDGEGSADIRKTLKAKVDRDAVAVESENGEVKGVATCHIVDRSRAFVSQSSAVYGYTVIGVGIAASGFSAEPCSCEVRGIDYRTGAPSSVWRRCDAGNIVYRCNSECDVLQYRRSVSSVGRERQGECTRCAYESIVDLATIKPCLDQGGVRIKLIGKCLLKGNVCLMTGVARGNYRILDHAFRVCGTCDVYAPGSSIEFYDFPTGEYSLSNERNEPQKFSIQESSSVTGNHTWCVVREANHGFDAKSKNGG